MTNLISASKPLVLRLIIFAVVGAVNASAQDADDRLFAQLQILQEQMHIQISGLENIQSESKTFASGSLEQQLEQLLSSYNTILNRNAIGKIERIVILNKKQKREVERIVLPTRLEGKHLMVSVSLSGDGRFWQSLDMVIDTGADLVVLPESMIPQLGLADFPFTNQKMQTANGSTDTKIGVLQELKIAGETVGNVEVAFVADKLLGDNRLLGMSVLGRYQINIDDKSQLITLFKK